MAETIIERLDEDEENDMNLAEQYEQWREKYSIADEEDDEGSSGEKRITGTHFDRVESEMADIKTDRWHRQKLEKEEKEKEEEEILKYKIARKLKKRLRITRRREQAIEKEEMGRGGGYRYFNEVSAKQGDSTGETKSTQSTDNSIPRTQQVHEKTGIEMLYWEEEIATWRTTKKDLHAGCFTQHFKSN